MSDKGTVKFFVADKYGRISRDGDGSEIFMPARSLPRDDKDATKGDRVEFDVEPDPREQGKFRAVNVRFLEKVPRKAPAVEELDVSLDFGTPETISLAVVTDPATNATVNKDHLHLDVWVVVMSNEKPVSGEAVELTANGYQVEQPAKVAHTTDGRAYFEVYAISPDSKIRFSYTVRGKNYTTVYPEPTFIPKPKPAPPPVAVVPKVLKTIRAFRSPKNAEGYTPFRVQAQAADGSGVDELIVPYSTDELEMMWQGQAHQGSFQTEKGLATIFVRAKNPKRATQVTFMSEATFIASDPQNIDAWEIETKAPAVCDTIEAKFLGYSNNWCSVEVNTKLAEKPLASEVIVSAESGEEVEVEGVGRGIEVEVKTPISGRLVVRMRFANPQQYRGNVVFRSKQKDEIRTPGIYLRQPKP